MAYDLSKAEAKARVYSYRVVQRNAFPGAPVGTLGWTDHSTRTCYVFIDRLTSFSVSGRPKAARAVAMHEVGHARWRARLNGTPNMVNYWRYVRGGTLGTDQQVEEDYCEVYSYCGDFQSGISYTFRSPVPTSSKIAILCTHL